MRAETMSASAPDPLDRRIVQQLQAGLPLVARPYDVVADAVGATPETVRARVGAMLADGRIRRIGAVIRHRRLGYQANAMVVWDVPDERVSELGRALASDAAVTLCYRRARALPDGPYNLYCMVHGREHGRVMYEVKRLSAAHGLGSFPRAVLFSTRCFSQRAAKYG